MASQTHDSGANASITPQQSAAEADDNDTFIINLRGVSIPLTRSQIEADSPGSNLFASSLLGDFIESSNKSMKLDRSPGLFRIILDHLSGYTILPLDKEMPKEYCGNGMSQERALRYLIDDSDYYGFMRLHNLLLEEMQRLQDSEDSYEEQLLALQKEKLAIKKAKLKLEIKNSNENYSHQLFDRRMRMLQVSIDVELKRMQYASTYAASRETGSAEYYVSRWSRRRPARSSA